MSISGFANRLAACWYIVDEDDNYLHKFKSYRAHPRLCTIQIGREKTNVILSA